MATGDVYEVTLLGLGAQSEAFDNVFHYVQTVGANDVALSQFEGLAAAVSATLIGPIAAVLLNYWVSNGWNVRCVKGNGKGLFWNSNADANTVGSIASATGNSVTCAIMKKITARPGKHGRGRNFFSPVSADFISQELVSTPFYAGVGALKAALLANVVLGAPVITLTPAVWDRVGLIASPVQVVTLAQLGGVQRRRRVRLPN